MKLKKDFNKNHKKTYFKIIYVLADMLKIKIKTRFNSAVDNDKIPIEVCDYFNIEQGASESIEMKLIEVIQALLIKHKYLTEPYVVAEIINTHAEMHKETLEFNPPRVNAVAELLRAIGI